MTSPAIRTAERSDAHQTAKALALTFQHDPVISWMLPSEGSRIRRLRRYYVTELRQESLRHKAVDVASKDGRIVGAALWLPPGTWSPAFGYLRAFGRRVDVASRYMSVANRAHPVDTPHWYLAHIGVDPSWRGQGVGSALLRSRLARCDEEGLPAY